MPKVVGYQWPMVTFVLMVVYTLTLVVYLGWPLTAINTPPTQWPFLSFTLGASILKTLLPIISVLLSVLQLIIPGVLWMILLYILLMLFNSICLVTLMVYYALFSNTSASVSSFGNDPLYCCKFFGVTSNCPSSYGPCASTPTLAINSDVWLLMIFAGIFVILEIMAFFFVHRMYQYYGRVYEKQRISTFNTTMTQKAHIGPSMLPEKLNIPFFTTTVPKWWSEVQKRVDGLFLMDDSHIAVAHKLANLKKDN